MHWRGSMRLLLLTSLMACGEGTGPDPDRICSRPLLVSATRSVTPVVTWAGGCRVNQVVIHQGPPDYSLAWAAFLRADSNQMLPPVEYGVVPSGAQQIPDNPQPLQPGTTYIIDVSISDTADAGRIVFVGSDTIVP